jgi:hypothetical protein
VHFTAAGQLRGPMRLLGPVVSRAMARQFAGYHRALRRNLETGPPSGAGERPAG